MGKYIKRSGKGGTYGFKDETANIVWVQNIGQLKKRLVFAIELAQEGSVTIHTTSVCFTRYFYFSLFIASFVTLL